jgi:hypothetical protein
LNLEEFSVFLHYTQILTQCLIFFLKKKKYSFNTGAIKVNVIYNKILKYLNELSVLSIHPSRLNQIKRSQDGVKKKKEKNCKFLDS